MAETTGISWTDATFNPWIGCAKVSPGCDHCYAEVSTPSRTMKIVWGPQEQRKRTSAGNWQLPLRWNAAHVEFFNKHGRRRRVFCASLSDVFDNRADPQWRAEMWTLIRTTPNLDWLVLTKRIGNAASMLPDDWGDGYHNVWLGASLVNREEMLRDAGKLKLIRARLRFWSVEPMLGDFGDIPLELFPEWVIAGGESGKQARPMNSSWLHSLRDQCGSADVPFFFKQWGGVAKDKGGCTLSGMEVKEWPIAA